MTAMRIYQDPAAMPPVGEQGRVVAIGVFDGVHRGHQRILSQAVEAGRTQGCPVAAVTFHPHPQVVLHPQPTLRLLTSLTRKAELIEALGVDELLVVKFDHDFAQLSPREFCQQVLSTQLCARLVLVGSNFRFGHQAAGTAVDLHEYGRSHHFEVQVVPLVELNGEIVSSTRIRALIGAGQVAAAAELLGRPHRLEGIVTRGTGRGRSLGAPTANLAVEAGIALPRWGVYVTRSFVEGGRVHPSVTSVGTNPTFEVDHKVRVETLFLDEGEEVYGCHLAVDFLEWIRGQEAFADPVALATQIKRDVEVARGYLSSRSDLLRTGS